VIVVDTSVLIDFLRGEQLPGAMALHRLEMEGAPFLVPGICYQEVLQGAKNEQEWNLLADTLGSQRLLFPRDPASTHLHAARIFFDCRRRGFTIRNSIDCFIAQLVLEQGGVLLHDDEDFERIRQVRPLVTVRS
jgi:predicted nucleic acid-binding protein